MIELCPTGMKKALKEHMDEVDEVFSEEREGGGLVKTDEELDLKSYNIGGNSSGGWQDKPATGGRGRGRGATSRGAMRGRGVAGRGQGRGNVNVEEPEGEDSELESETEGESDDWEGPCEIFRSLEDEEHMLICDSCNEGYHTVVNVDMH